MAQEYAVNVWILAVTVALCLIPVKATSNCTSRMERGDAVEQCFNDQGLEAPDVFESYASDGLSVENLFMLYGDSFCANHSTELKAALRCSYQIDLDCADDLQRSLMPSPDDSASTVDPICDNLENLNFPCIQRSAEGDCVAKRVAKELQTISDVNQIKCLSRLITAECVKKEFKPCGCTSSKVYSDFTMDILMPNSCGLTTARVVCSQTNPNEFVDDGLNGVTRHGLAMGLMAVSVLVLSVIF